MSELIECIDGLTAENILKRAAKTANGVPFYINTLGLGGWCDEYQTIYDYMVTLGSPPSSAVADAQNTMLCGLVDAGIWATRDLFYLFAQEFNTAMEARFNWKNPGTHNIGLVNAPTWTSLEGYQGNGTNSYLRTYWTPNTHGVNYLQNDANAAWYVRNNTVGAHYDFGCNDAGQTKVLYGGSRYTGDVARVQVNDQGVHSVANTDSRGMWFVNRPDAANHEMYRNKVRIINQAQASTGRSTKELYICVRNSNGTPAQYSDKQISVFSIGAKLAQSDIDTFTDLVEGYMDAVGKGVI